uniref:Glyoxalase domain-containing protein n=1 Tax=Colobus angolensis palliatus TaxID=336983 RepID=A0A2K5ICL9_COLAP
AAARRELTYVLKQGSDGIRACPSFFKIHSEMEFCSSPRLECSGVISAHCSDYTRITEDSFSKPYDGKWSKTMVGFGPEDDHFVAELTYNYGIGDYKLGNDFMGLTLASSQAVSNARKLEWPLTEVAEGVFETEAPGGYKFYLQNRSLPQSGNYTRTSKSLCLKCKLELQGVKGAVDHAAAFGRIAFSCPQKELPDLEDLMKRENQKILTPLVSLDTPGKATVQVVILADPDGHEICFVGDEAFRELSKVDPQGSKLLDD